LRVGTLNVSKCTELTDLPEGLDVWFLNTSGCTKLSGFPRRARIERGSLQVNGCPQLTGLPEYVTELAALDVGNCPRITEFSTKLRVTSWVEIAGSGLTGLPPQLQSVGIRWRGVLIDHATAFCPALLKAKNVVRERNAERRRVMIERMGFSRFISEVGAETLNADQDPGGPRELLRVPMKGDEDIVCLSVNCPSTGRHYLLRVPPTMKTCSQAAAWMAGFDDPNLYLPVKET
jgi:hypothetical protein